MERKPAYSEAQSEREVIEENYAKLQTEFNALQKKYTKLQNDYEEFRISSNNGYEQELHNLKQQLTKAEGDMEKQKSLYEGKLASKVTELDELESN
ncbi:Protein lava lamp [Eumeta japonica]|uniref:Protein lava lamp n=1 Tax=Eumeta variegata TaxID=151549 RepID=A0A4C2ABM4_EUMVA|nr:Protein lava lamp [Eumeta japonica]